MGFFYSQFFARLPYPTGSYTGKTVIITGSNVGLGKEAARHFVRMGASKLILAVRSLDKGAAAQLDIEATTKCSKNVIQVWKLDMASYASVQQFSARVDAELDRVDIFIANAGIAPGKYAISEDNEASITVNVVSTLLLTALVLPKMKATAAKFGTRPTLTITSSDVHGHTKFPQKSAPDGEILASVNDKQTAEKHWDDQYPISKLLEVFAVRSIAELYGSSKYPVTINTVNPGLCHSELGRDFGFGFWLIKLVLARSTEVGSRTLVHAASGGHKIVYGMNS
ncbi:putative short-chain dehydrogenase [Phaeosphaeriaceae sp. PMI808]|nr:putative short-chain dehydrogenase [Phaeosphaeriaceae sp. PMI808]